MSEAMALEKFAQYAAELGCLLYGSYQSDVR